MSTDLQPDHAVRTMAASELEVMIGESVQRIFTDQVTPELLKNAEAGVWSADLWQIVEDNGLSLALCRGETGGSDASWLEASPVLTGIGRWTVPLPLAETMIATSLLDRAGVAFPAGPITIAVGTGLARAANGALSGVLPGVPWASRCGQLLLSLTGADGAASLALVDLTQPGVSIRCGVNMAAEARDEVCLKAVQPRVVFDNPLPNMSDPLYLLGALARCAMLTGALERVLELAVQYTNDRVQFGKPLSKNQVIQHGLAVVASETVASQVATRVAFFSMQAGCDGKTTAFDVAVAKVRAGQASARMAAVAHQFHGAIGYSWEHVLHYSTRRLWSWRTEFGSDATWAAALGRAAIAQGAAGFWPAMTQRSLALNLATPR